MVFGLAIAAFFTGSNRNNCSTMLAFLVTIPRNRPPISDRQAMSEQAAAAPTTDEELFSRSDLKQFAADDVEAGGAIGKMLTAFFAYTVVVMSLVAWWTFNDTNDRANGSGAPVVEAGH